jgi:rSAM/selenodomain-associated transferase 1
MSRTERTAALVFAKAPVAGEVKTRLVPPLSPAEAARLHENLVRRALAAVREAGLGEVILCCAPDCAHPFFRRCAVEFGVVLQPQSTGNLGDRMHQALDRALQTCDRALLIGTDCPALDAKELRSAAAALEPDADLVFVPAEDGGYALIGARRIEAAVFDAIDWGSAAVMQQTRERLQTLGWQWHERPTLWDVDRPADLERLLQSGFRLLASGPAAETA